MKIIDFWAPWCGPCKQMKPIIEKLESEYAVQKVNIDEDPETAVKYGVMSIPTLLIMDGDKEIKRFIGYTNHDTIKSAINV